MSIRECVTLARGVWGAAVVHVKADLWGASSLQASVRYRSGPLPCPRASNCSCTVTDTHSPVPSRSQKLIFELHRVYHCYLGLSSQHISEVIAGTERRPPASRAPATLWRHDDRRGPEGLHSCHHVVETLGEADGDDQGGRFSGAERCTS